MNSTQTSISMPFWHSILGKALRWIFFLPVGFLAVVVLEAIPIFAYGFAANLELRFTLLTLIIGVIAASLLFAFLWFWVAGVVMTPMLTCGLIAPTPKVASVIFGTAFALLQGLSLLALVLSERIGWGSIIYKILFSLLFIGGAVAAYCGSESKHGSAHSDDVMGSMQGEPRAATPSAVPAPGQAEQAGFSDGFGEELRERACDFAATDFRGESKQYQERAAKFIYNRIRMAARHHFSERNTMEGFRDAEQMRIAAARFRESTRPAFPAA